MNKKPDKQLIKIFVYGTLKPGECNYGPYCAGKTIYEEVAYVKGKLYDIPQGYPAMIESDSLVEGVLLTFEEEKYLNQIDKLEGYDHHLAETNTLYTRKEVDVLDKNKKNIGKAWTYYMKEERAQSLGGVPIKENTWASSAGKEFNHEEHFKFLAQAQKNGFQDVL